MFESSLFENQVLDTSINLTLNNSSDPLQKDYTDFSSQQLMHFTGEILIDAWENQGNYTTGNILEIVDTVNQAISFTKSTLIGLVNNPHIDEILGTSFGINYNQDIADDLLNRFANNDFSQSPHIKLVSGQVFNGAYAWENNTIYLSQEFVADNLGNISFIQGVLLEEFGHYLDAQINVEDAAGDEGEIFAGLLEGKSFSTHELQTLKLEDDSATIIIDGQELKVEQSFGNNIKLDGVDDYLSISIDVPETEVTHEFRFKTTDANAGLFAVVDGDLGTGGHDRHIYLKDGNINTRLWNTEIIQSTGLNLADGNWHHVAYVVGASVGGQKLYVDGQLVASGNKVSSDFNWQKRINLGFSNDAQNKFLNGEIDEVRVWGKTLSQVEIQSSMDKELAGNETGLIGYWKLNETTGDVAVDATSANHNGELRNNPTWVSNTIAEPVTNTSNFNGSLKLDGVDDYLSISIDVPETEVTHEFRFKTTDANAGLFAVVDGDLGTGGHDRHIYLKDGNINTRLWNTEIIQSTGLNLADGNWHHVAYVVGASVGGQKLYVDGQLVASGNKVSSDFNWQKRINLGFSNDAQNKFLNGEIDEVRVWGKTLSQVEIQSSMDKELAGNETGLIGYWKLNETTGDVAVDATSANHNGELRNNPTWVNNPDNTDLTDTSKQWNVSFINRDNTNYSAVDEYDFSNPVANQVIDRFDLNGNLQFDGVDDYVNLPAMTFGGAVTVEAWVYVDEHQWWQRVIDFGNGAASDNIFLAWSENTGKMAWGIFQGNNSQRIVTDDVFPTKQWVHVAAVNDEQGNAYIYWNGELKASGHVFAPLNVARDNNYIGRSNWSSDPAYFKGKMNDVRIWNTARTQTDIKNSLNQELTGNEAGLLGYWKFNEETGNVAVDSTSANRNGTLINNPTWNTSNLASLTINFGEGSPAPNVQKDNFVMQAWTTTYLESGKYYQVTTQSDDGTRFFVKNIATDEITYIGADWRNRGVHEPAPKLFFNVNQTGDYEFYIQGYDHSGASTFNVELKEIPENALPNHTGLIKDINKDGKHDILWRNYSNAETHFWSMDGGTRLGGVDIPDNLDMAWHPVAMADFNNDGNLDIFWRYHWLNNTGHNRIWLMDGNTRLAEVGIERVEDNKWHIVGTGDFNLDGNVDILWRNYDIGENVIWQMNGTTRTNNISLETVADLNQRIVGTGDFDGDGKSDILWRDAANGHMYIWFMNGITKSSVQTIFSSTDLSWSVAGTGDINNDGKSDIIWRNLATGGNTSWLMNGATKLGNLDIQDVPERNWNIVGDSDIIPIWTAEYFANKDLAGTPTHTEGFINIDGKFSRYWGHSAPPNTPVDQFSARFKTQQYLNPGIYKVKVNSDDGVRVWINNELIIDKWIDQAGNYSDYFTSSGGYYPVAIDYKENGLSAGINYEIVKHQPYNNFGDPDGIVNSWNATFYHWNGKGNPIFDDNHKIGTVNLGGNIRGDGTWGMNPQNWGTGSPAPEVPTDFFAMRAYTRVNLTAGHKYKVWLRSDDGYRMWAHKLGGKPFNITENALGGTFLSDAFGGKEFTFVAPESGTFDFHAQMFERGGDAYFDLSVTDLTTSPPPPPPTTDPGYVYKDADYLNALYQDNVANGFSRKDHDGTSAFDSDDSAPNGADSDNRVYALVGGEVIEAKNGKEVSSKYWGYNGTVAIYNKDLNKTFIYWHFAEGSIDENLQGKTIAAGSLIGIEGSTGNSTGNHTHVEIHEGRAYVDMSNPNAPKSPANSGRLDVAAIFQEAVRRGLVKLYK